MADQTPEIGKQAPGFTLPANGGQTISLSDYAGKPVVLYFYPKDDTPGCTKEAIGFTEMVEEFAAAGAVVIGASKDPVAKHDKFIAKHDLKIALVSDEDGDLCESYGVWVEKNMYGKKYMGIERSTFVIDGEGVLAKEWRKVKVPGHVESVLEFVRSL
ncbi:thioredoxin-dependent thiol peroxidase [Rhodobacteraceae bacterium NNCM2]|nr:thioredoxin-dependent thiol peroxidase [Coraliihabitans acroporae]